MPDGTMTVCQMNSSLPGYEGYGTYEITYNFKAGVHVSGVWEGEEGEGYGLMAPCLTIFI